LLFIMNSKEFYL